MALPRMPRPSSKVSSRFSSMLSAFVAMLTAMGRLVSPQLRMNPQHWKYMNQSGGASEVKP